MGNNRFGATIDFHPYILSAPSDIPCRTLLNAFLMKSLLNQIPLDASCNPKRDSNESCAMLLVQHHRKRVLQYASLCMIYCYFALHSPDMTSGRSVTVEPMDELLRLFGVPVPRGSEMEILRAALEALGMQGRRMLLVCLHPDKMYALCSRLRKAS